MRFEAATSTCSAVVAVVQGVRDPSRDPAGGLACSGGGASSQGLRYQVSADVNSQLQYSVAGTIARKCLNIRVRVRGV